MTPYIEDMETPDWSVSDDEVSAVTLCSSDGCPLVRFFLL